MAKHQRSRYLGLLDDDNFRRWYQNVARGHSSTAKNYLRCVGKLCEMINHAPEEFINLPQRERDDIILDYISRREKKGITGASIKVKDVDTSECGIIGTLTKTLPLITVNE